MKIIKIFSIVLYFLLLGCFIIPSTQASIAGDNILITEVLYDAPNSDATEEWFELFNPTDSDINLTGWSVADNYGILDLTGIIPAKGFFVAAVDETGFFNLYGYNANQSGGWDGVALSNSGDQLMLYNDTVEVDFVSWENYVEGWTVGAQDTTIRRISGVDTDTVADWENSLTTGDPGFGDYIVVVPELPQSLASIFLVLTGIATIVGLSKRKKRN